MTKFLGILLLTFALCSCHQKAQNQDYLTKEQLALLVQNKAKASCSFSHHKNNKTLFVFTLEKCPYCIEQEHILKALKNINVCTFLINPAKDDTIATTLAKEFHIHAVPTFILPDGQKIIGKQSLTNLLNDLKNYD